MAELNIAILCNIGGHIRQLVEFSDIYGSVTCWQVSDRWSTNVMLAAYKWCQSNASMLQRRVQVRGTRYKSVGKSTGDRSKINNS